jgi:ubiquinone/menaquinone biosynthesis C-methylase UbiE
VGRPESGPVTLAVHPIRETIMTALTGTGPPASAGEDLTLSGPDSPGLDPQQAYALGADTDERTRLTRQSDELRPEAEALLARIGLRPGDAALDLGCGPRGILDLLAAAVSPGGRVVGLDADPGHVATAAAGYPRSGPGNVRVIRGDARHTRLPAGSFDLVHARTLLVTIPEPAGVLAEMVRLARPGGWVAGQEPDVEHALCYPPLPAWDRLWEIFRAAFTRAGADLHIGRRLAQMYRQAGLVDVQVQVYAGVYPAGHSRRTVIPDLVRSLRPVIAQLGLASDDEMNEVDRAVRRHLDDPDTLMMPHLLVAAWGRKPS